MQMIIVYESMLKKNEADLKRNFFFRYKYIINIIMYNYFKIYSLQDMFKG